MLSIRFYLFLFLIVSSLIKCTAVWATCAPNGSITGTNNSLILGSADCATASGNTANVDVTAFVDAGLTGDALSAPAPDAWDITNNGTIAATAGTGISIEKGGSILNSADGLIFSSQGNGIVSNGGAAVPPITLENYGDILTIASGTGSSGGLLLGGATVINHVGATIAGDFCGLSISANGPDPSGGPSFVDNAGTIFSNTGFNDGILLGLGGTVINRATGIITGGIVGIAISEDFGSVENFGTIGIDTGSTGIGLGAGGSVINHIGAQIIGPSRGISVDGGSGTISNSGSIIASVSRAISMSAGGSVINTAEGTITAGSRAVFIDGASGVVQNAGTIIGDTGGVGFPAIELGQSSGNSSFVSNTGRISGDVSFDASSNDFFLMTAGQMTGRLIMGATLGHEVATFQNVNDTNIGGITLFNGRGRGYDVLNFNNTQHTGGNEMINWETINVTNGSTLTLSSNLLLGGISADPTATLNIESSTLKAINGANAVIAGVVGQSTLVNNSGTVDLRSTTATNTLTIRGHYVGHSALLLNTVLGGDNSPSDKLIIDGQNGNAQAGGNTQISINNLGGSGGLTFVNGILVVEAINNATTNADAFALSSPIRVGLYEYRLFRGGLDPSVSTTANDWFLRSTFGANHLPILGPELSVYASVLPTAIELGRFVMGTLHERVGSETHLLSDNPTDFNNMFMNGAWLRVISEPNWSDYSSIAQPSISGTMTGFQIGADVYRNTTVNGQLDLAGVYVAYLSDNPDVNGIVTNTASTAYVRETTGSLKLYSNVAGIYATHFWPSKAYLDLVAQGSFYGGNASSFRTSIPTTGQGLLGSAELGYPLRMMQHWNFEPQAQLAYQHVSFQDTADNFSTISLGTDDVLVGRIGARIEHGSGSNQILPFLRANLWSILSGGNATTVFGTNGIATKAAATWTQLGGGFTWPLNKDVHLYAFADVLLGLYYNHQGQHGADAGIGLRANW